jgi:putative ABC transport system ATP-binding protein
MIVIRDFHKRFNAGTLNEVYALRGITLNIKQGEFVTIIGTNGSGKSTLLNAISGTLMPDAGNIFIGDLDVTRHPEHKRAQHISRVFQNPFSGTAPGMTIAENLHMAYLRGKHRFPTIGLTNARQEIFKEQVALLEMQLEGRLDNTIGSLSGGQRQAITLLMAVLTKPKILLLDEHTAALDPKSAAQVIRLTKKFIERDGLTAIMVTHSMQQALDLGTRTIMMNKGEIIDDMSLSDKEHSTVDDLLDRFAELRKNELLTSEMIEELRREYN